MVEMLTRPPSCLRLFQQTPERLRGLEAGRVRHRRRTPLSNGHPSSSPSCRQTSDCPVSTLHRNVPHPARLGDISISIYIVYRVISGSQGICTRFHRREFKTQYYTVRIRRYEQYWIFRFMGIAREIRIFTASNILKFKHLIQASSKNIGIRILKIIKNMTL